MIHRWARFVGRVAISPAVTTGLTASATATVVRRARTPPEPAWSTTASAPKRQTDIVHLAFYAQPVNGIDAIKPLEVPAFGVALFKVPVN